jgi:type II secretory pathway pseudopilin PulG
MYLAQSKKKQNTKSKTDNPRFINGFTVLELLIVIMTMFLVFTVGMANLRGFQRRRVLEGAVVQVKSHLRLAQEMAISGAKPPACSALKLESITFQRDVTTPTIYHIRARCTDFVNPTINVPVATYDLDPEFAGINIGSTALVTFLTLGKGVLSDVNLSLSQPETGATQTVTITKGGEIR